MVERNNETPPPGTPDVEALQDRLRNLRSTYTKQRQTYKEGSLLDRFFDGVIDGITITEREVVPLLRTLSAANAAQAARIAELEADIDLAKVEQWGRPGPGVVQRYTNAPDWLEATMLGASTAELKSSGFEAPHRSLRRLAINMTSAKTWVHQAIIPTILETLADRVEALADGPTTAGVAEPHPAVIRYRQEHPEWRSER